MAYTTIDDPSEYFHIQLYNGDSNDNRDITNDANAGDFKPDWLWIKERTSTSSHQLVDSNRGTRYAALTDSTNAEDDDQNRVQAFNTDGFQVGTASTVNENSQTYVAWQWKANGGTATATISESGNNPAATVQANTTAGFSIITYTGTGASGTIAHGLGARPKMVWIKNRDANEGWFINAELITNNTNGGLHFNTDAEYTGGSNNMTDSSIDTNNIHVISSGNVNTDGQKYVAYVSTPIQGYSKFGVFHSDNNHDGTFVYLGFKPKLVIAKNITQQHANHNWIMFDSVRETRNEIDNFLEADKTDTETTSGRNEVDFLSNGFKARASYGDFNGGSNHEFIYYAWAEHPFVSSKGIPVTAF